MSFRRQPKRPSPTATPIGLPSPANRQARRRGHGTKPDPDPHAWEFVLREMREPWSIEPFKIEGLAEGFAAEEYDRCGVSGPSLHPRAASHAPTGPTQIGP